MSKDQAPDDPREAIVAYLPLLRAFAISLTRNSDSADDLVQDKLVKAWRSFGSFQEGSNLQAWLFTILRNTFYTDLGRQKRRSEAAIEGDVYRACVKPDHDGRLAVKDFQRFFNMLPDEQREVLTLVAAVGSSYEEAAETCGVAVGTIKSRISRGRARLAELMQASGSAELISEDPVTASVVQTNPASAARFG